MGNSPSPSAGAECSCVELTPHAPPHSSLQQPFLLAVCRVPLPPPLRRPQHGSQQGTSDLISLPLILSGVSGPCHPQSGRRPEQGTLPRPTPTHTPTVPAASRGEHDLPVSCQLCNCLPAMGLQQPSPSTSLLCGQWACPTSGNRPWGTRGGRGSHDDQSRPR